MADGFDSTKRKPQAVRVQRPLASAAELGAAATQHQAGRVDAMVNAGKKVAGIADGIEVRDATMGEFEEARRVQAAKRAPGVGVVRPSALTPAEAASFDAQSKGRFSAANPTAPTVANVQARTNMGATPAPRPAAPAAGIADDLMPQPSRAGQIGEAAGQRVRDGLARAKPATKLLGRAAAPIGAVMEGMDVARVAANPNASGLDVAEQAAEGVGKLATAGAGAKLGAAGGSVFGPVGTVVGGVAGGIAGYYGGEKLIEKGKQFFGGDGASPVDEIGAGLQAAGSVAKADFSNVVGGSAGSVQGQPTPEAIARQAANDGITPVADRRGAPGEVLGTFNGKAITREDSDRLSGGTSFGGNNNAPALGDGLLNPRQPTGGVSAGSIAGGAEDRARDISDTQTPAGKLYATLSADKTPTGKRMAAQFLETYLGTGTQERGQNAGLRADEIGANAGLMRGREGDAASLQEQALRNKGDAARPQYVFNEDGSIAQISDGVMSAVRDESGQPAKGGKKAGKSNIAGLKEQEELVQLRIGKAEDYASGEDYQAARAKALQELMAELNGDADGA